MPRRPKRFNHIDNDYSPDQVEWIKSIAKWMAERRRRPEAWEVLQIAKSLGYRLRPDGN